MRDRENELPFHVRWLCSYFVFMLWTNCYWGPCSRGRHVRDVPQVWEATDGWGAGESCLKAHALASWAPSLPFVLSLLLSPRSHGQVEQRWCLNKPKVIGAEYAWDTCRNQMSQGRHFLVPISETWSKLYTNPNTYQAKILPPHLHLMSLGQHPQAIGICLCDKWCII